MRRKTVTVKELQRLSFCNSRRLPKIVEHDGKRKEWVGIGWIVIGTPTGKEVLVVNR